MRSEQQIRDFKAAMEIGYRDRIDHIDECDEREIAEAMVAQAAINAIEYALGCTCERCLNYDKLALTTCKKAAAGSN